MYAGEKSSMFLSEHSISYYKSGNFRENFIFANSVKRHSCAAKNSRLVHYLPITVIDGVISPFCGDFIFTKLSLCQVSRK